MVGGRGAYFVGHLRAALFELRGLRPLCPICHSRPAGRLRPPAGWLRQPCGGQLCWPGLRPGWLRQPCGGRLRGRSPHRMATPTLRSLSGGDAGVARQPLGCGWLRGRSPRRMGQGGLRGRSPAKPPTRTGRSLRKPFGPWVLELRMGA